MRGGLERSLMEKGKDEEMRELVDADETRAEVRQELDARGNGAPVLIGLRGDFAADVSDGVQGD
jgi:hypothetical protein